MLYILFFFFKKLRPRNEQRENELIISFLRCLYEEKQKVHVHIGEIKQVWHFSVLKFYQDTVWNRVLRIFWSFEPSFSPVILFPLFTPVEKIGEYLDCAWEGEGSLCALQWGTVSLWPGEWRGASRTKFTSRCYQDKLLDLHELVMSVTYPHLSPWWNGSDVGQLPLELHKMPGSSV